MAQISKSALFCPLLSVSLGICEARLFTSTSDHLSVANGATEEVSGEQTKHGLV